MSKVDTSSKLSKSKGLTNRVVVLLTNDQQAWLQAHSAATSVPVTAILRRAVEQYRQGIDRKAAKASKPLPSSEPAPF